MANQPKTAKQLESELQAAMLTVETAQEAVKKLEKDLAEARKAEADKAARLKAAAEKRAKKVLIKRKAELDTILVDYDDVVTTPVKKDAPSKPTQAPKPPEESIKTAPKQEANPQKTGLLGWLNEKA